MLAGRYVDRVEDGINRYAYAVNNPVNRIDPLGTVSQSTNNFNSLNSSYYGGNAIDAQALLAAHGARVPGYNTAQFGLDALSLSEIPVVSQLAGLGSAAISLASGDLTGALLGVAGVVPGIGAAADAARIGRSSASTLANAGEDLFVGTYSRSRRANINSGLNATHTPHHVLQNAISPTSHGRGITINIRKDLHEQTRTFRRPVDSGLDTRTHLARDIRDLRGILDGAGYNRSTVNRHMQELIRQNKELGL